MSGTGSESTNRSSSGTGSGPVALAVAAVLLGGYAGLIVTATPSSAVVIDERIPCAELLPPDYAEAFAGAGYELVDLGEDPSGDPNDPFVANGGSSCRWGIPQSDILEPFSYSPLDDAAAQEQRNRLLGEGYSQEQTDDGLILRPPPEEGFGNFFPDYQYVFTDGFWFNAGSPEIIAQMRETVDAAEPPAEPEPEPTVEPDPLPEVTQQEVLVEEPVTALLPDQPPEIQVFGAAEPSVLSGLRPVGDVVLTPAVVTGTVTVAVIFAAIVGLPGKLMEQALAGNWDRIRRHLTPLTTPLHRWRESPGARTVTARLSAAPQWAAIAGGVVIASILSGFIDPEFGLNPGSLRMFLSFAVTFMVEGLLGLAVIALILRSRGETVGLHLRYGSLLVIVAAVVLSRVTEFQPGVVFGLIIALSYASTGSLRREAALTGAEVGYVLALGIGSWLTYSELTERSGASPGPLDVFVIETAAGLAIGCLAALPLVLLPWRGLPGGTLYAFNRRLWAASYLVASLTFVVVVIPFPESWQAVETSLITWIALYLVYAAMAVFVWWWLTHLWPGTDDPAEPEALDPELEGRR
ncbi:MULTISPECIES: hypothetical protein [unclassified Arthrobacter]|uniref:hypothetical protein n=1 Tax=unclassified Arthrobacter TaxID=235627 RepID=UPI001490EEEC|nr:MULTISPECIES: hypothetical protein [unclassified Arthrobacter]MBE0010478.1 hypothetical protein [Arthrobacter sp. AET 35A]NOJ58701.1 hypothetical protein [Arthrobacter sp. 260]NOJ62362.1 hypothetical protein [Arthrobacter sp. 147(2020)]